MLTKILFTLVVIVVVALVFKTKTAEKAKVVERQPEPEGALSVRTVAYLIIAILVIISATVFVFKYQSDNQIVNIKVISEDGTSTVYQARQKDIKGRSFTTLDSTQVDLGESDRVEMENQ